MSNQEHSDISTTQQDDLLREQFFSYIFHELRTPLTVIYSYAQILNSKLPAGPEFNSQRRVTEQIVTQGDELVEMLDELMEATRIPLGRLNLDLVEYDLVELVESLLEGLGQTEHSSVNWSGAAQPIAVLAEGPRLERALLAVLKFGLTVTAHLELKVGLEPSSKWVVLTFQTPDWLLPDGQSEVLFDLYRPVRPNSVNLPGNPRAGNLDISLYVSRGMIEGHGGNLTYQSDLPGFVVRLPIAQ